MQCRRPRVVYCCAHRHVELDLQNHVLVSPAGGRLARARPDPARPRDRATPAPHVIGERSGAKRRARIAGSVERCSRGRLARPPLWRGIIKTWTWKSNTILWWKNEFRTAITVPENKTEIFNTLAGFFFRGR